MKRTVIALLWIFLPLVQVQAAEVPFLSQAPTGQWWDRRQGQGCEETAAIMAVTWARGQIPLTPKQGRNRIVGISDWEFRNYGYYVDTSIQDTADLIIKGYLKYENIQVKKNISVKNIAADVYAGNIAIIAINGRRLSPNNHYRYPGPLHHVLLVTDYNRQIDVFTVHDPGSRHGANLKYTGPQLQRALQDYESGNGRSRKVLPPAMVVVYRQ